ncbi:MAG: Biotin carboxylase [candidate division WS2 bacterium]|nr:Biotin carboxylase [Candidatus Lithacetigena glycinireducens]MBT9174809.1 Biotin carboxylase [Candidatus Lithacetigena glycinireducens]
MFKKILIANRGEIAVRIIRTCREMGIPTVAIYSQADRDSLHVKFADEAFCVGGPASRDSYLNIPNILSGADVLQVEAIHPGYGFLSENARFVKILEECNFKFIGPSRESIELGSHKAHTCDTMKTAGLPIVEGFRGNTEDEQDLLNKIKNIGFPVMLKASAGGGGKGMRIVHNEKELAKMVPMVKKEAEISFGSGDFYVEKYLGDVRHIEFQVLADNYGEIIHLGERECTIQRRHQKIIEESPSPFLDEQLREEMAESAIEGARSLKYRSLGTMEFLVDSKRNFYFIEINTRIQVEHPVTEMVFGLDLVREQIQLAAGKKLSLKQSQARPKGHCIECRILAEDIDKGFIPSTGKIEGLYIPGGFGVRVDTHIYSGYEITPYYDSLLAKLICWGKDRKEAIVRCYNSLDEFNITGVKTNIPLLKRIMKDKEFIKGNFTTDYLGKMA